MAEFTTPQFKGTIHFGDNRYEDYTTHKDSERRDRYILRHRVTQDWNDPYKAGTLSYYILWGPSTNRQKNIANYKRQFGLV